MTPNPGPLGHVVERAPVGCVVLDSNARFVYVNHAAAALLEHERDSLVGLVAWDVFPAAVSSAFFEYFERITTERHVRFEEYLEPLGIWLEVDAQLADVGIVAWFRDVSEAHRREEATRLVLDQVPPLVWTTDVDLRFTSVGGGGVADLKRAPLATVGAELTTLVPDGHPAIAAHRRALEGEPAEYEFESDGRIFNAYVRAEHDARGRAVVGTVGIAVDVTERRAAERAVAESQRLYRVIVETADEGIWLIDADERTTFVNARMANLLGYEPEELIGLRPHGFLAPEFVDRGLRSLEQRRRGITEGLALQFVHRDGTLVDTWVNASTVLDEDGCFAGALVMVTDARERIAQERRFRAVFDGAADAMILADDNRRNIDVNDAACHLFGKSREELLTLRSEDLFAGGDTEATLPVWKAFLRTGRQRGEFALTLPHGGSRHVSYAATANVVPGLHLSILRDITEQVEAEQRYRSLVEQLPLTMYVKDAETRQLTYISPQVVAFLGYSIGDWLTPDFWKTTLHSSDRERVVTLVDEAHRSHEPFAAEYRILAADGRVVWVADATVPVRDDSGRVTYLQGFVHDITERKALEEQLRQSQKMETVGRLAGGLAHDFNNLLTAISGYADLAAARIGEGHAALSDVDEVKRAASRAGALINQLLAFSRRQVLEPRVLSLNDSVRDLEGILRRTIGAHIKLVSALDDQLELVKADPTQLEQVVLNLAVNARDAMPDGGTLMIATHNAVVDYGASRTHPGIPPGDYVQLTVTDTGHGMDEDTLSRIFEPFFTTKGVGEGTGLGLATVHGIVSQSGGHIWVYSEPGLGTTFKIFFPVTTEAAVGEPAAEELSTSAAAANATVLLLEDEPIVRQLVREILEQDGFRVIEAGAPEHALELEDSETSAIDLLLTDVVMPGMTGPEVARRLALRIQGAQPLKVLYMSGYSDEAVRPKLLDPGSAFLQKPFTARQLTTKVRALLEAA